MSATIRDIVDDALSIVGEVAGAGVQTYSDDRMFQDAIRAFNMVFKKYNWRQYAGWSKLTLDGSTGKVVENTLAAVADFDDFIEIRRDQTNAVISVMPRDINPFSPQLTSGSSPRYWDSLNAVNDIATFATKRIRFYPITATGSINIYAKYHPHPAEDWDWNDTMYFDRDMLAHGTAYATLSGDDLNPDAAEAQRLLMEDKFKTITSNLSSHKILLGTNSGIPQNWTDQYGSMS